MVIYVHTKHSATTRFDIKLSEIKKFIIPLKLPSRAQRTPQDVAPLRAEKENCLIFCKNHQTICFHLITLKEFLRRSSQCEGGNFVIFHFTSACLHQRTRRWRKPKCLRVIEWRFARKMLSTRKRSEKLISNFQSCFE